MTFILLSAGGSTRFKTPVKKQWLRIGHDPLWLFVTNRIKSFLEFDNIIIVAHPDETDIVASMCDFTVVAGGLTRQQSLKNALSHVTTPYVMVSDVARACISNSLINSLLEHKGKADSIVPSLGVHDTVAYENQTINRDKIRRIQTPQLSKTEILRKSLDTLEEYTDESSAIVASGGTRMFIEGDLHADKLTRVNDISLLSCLEGPSNYTFTGNGFDVHPFEDGKIMVLGGIEIESPFGFKAHSDGDVAIHALIDALLGAASLGDIGSLFPDTDMTYKNIDSKILLEKCVTRLHQLGYVILHSDITIIAQTPKIAPYKDEMRKILSTIMQISPSRCNVKATTTEHLGFIGRKEGIGVLATATLHYFDWKQR